MVQLRLCRSLVQWWVVPLASVSYRRGAFYNANRGNGKRAVKAWHPIALDHTQAPTVLTPMAIETNTAYAAAVANIVAPRE